MARLWIIHRDPAQREALARQLGSDSGSEDVLLVGPGEVPFGADAPRAVVMGLVDDFEQELHFAHRNARRLADCRWILVASQEDGEDVARLFDLLRSELVRAPAAAAELRACVQSALARRTAEPLSERRHRERVAERFARWFAGFEPPELLRALDPRLAKTSLLVRGEPGCGRGLLARYVHSIGLRGGDPLIAIPCAGVDNAAALEEQLAGIDSSGSEGGLAVLLEDVDRLPAALQARVREWIEYGLPANAPRVRWLASAAADTATLAPALTQPLLEALSGLEISIPPLRERPGAARALATATATAWARARALRPRAIAEEALAQLEREAWPGNQRELEAAVVSALSRSAADPLCADAFDAVPLTHEPEAPPQVSLEGAEEEAETSEAIYPDEALSEHEPEPIAVTELLDGEVEEILEPLASGGGGVVPLPARESYSEPQPVEPEISAGAGTRDRGWQRLVAAVAHEVGNPLVSIRTFAELLPEHYHDEEFRSRFSELVSADVRRIEAVVARLRNLSLSDGSEHEPIDVSEMLSTLLEEMRDDIQRRHLLVLKELDRERPFALADPVQLRGAVAGLLGRALSLVAERGDLYLASRYHATGLRSGPCVRVLLRYRSAPGSGSGSGDGLAPNDHEIDFAFAETVVSDAHGVFAIDSHGEDTVIVIDLPAPL